MNLLTLLSCLFCLGVQKYSHAYAPFSGQRVPFTFSGDVSLGDPKGGGNTGNIGNIGNIGSQPPSGKDKGDHLQNYESHTKEENNREDLSNESVIESVHKANEAVKKEYSLENLPTSGLSQEDEEEAREDSEFLSDDLEEAAQNFAAAQDKGDGETEEEETNVRKYQAEVINAMSQDTLYKKFDAGELEKVEQAMEDSEEACLEDFSLPCPLHFFRTSSGCVPLSSYEGPCRKVQDKLAHLYDHQKESWGEICDATWPCLPKTCPYGVDYDAPCPISWTDQGKGTCASASGRANGRASTNGNTNGRANANAPCERSINFANLSIAKKKQMEEECGVRWRCKSVTFETNFDDVCPLNWQQVGEHRCKAPTEYDGPCPKIANLKKYISAEGKRSVENVCLVNWPYTVTVNQYQRDYSAPCPIGWSPMDNGLCLAPENYQKSAKCSDEVAFAAMSSQQKDSHSTACEVDFPFKERGHCLRNYSFACPLGWVPSSKRGYCKAPVSYKSKICKRYYKFENVSDSQKNYFLKFCAIDWPCEGEIQNSAIYTRLPVGHSTERAEKWASGIFLL
ncbi:hypothetical protein, conserved [Plasmodium vivax]|uniref:CPW-WPC domain-containing protein n=1 Tax=Plasmodium vivax (strain Salvador I) TaxID=126793 RepID=A5K833_PLAVS|nr:hypothetical protein, conserved [Plasmodium vivax]EDL44447.1 hypothetical protein, conserved [Plasmodium vivax]|eukprot:XP_001614174.1 hypothetical protein [Plasmodium vivax Sal-1]